MKRWFLAFSALVSLCMTGLLAQTNVPKYRVVFEVLHGPEQWETYMKSIRNVQKALGVENVEIEVVVHGQALHMMRTTNDDTPEIVRSEISELSRIGVDFAVCSNSMRSRNVSKEELYPFAVVVDAALAEIIRKQEEGWSFIKLGS